MTTQTRDGDVRFYVSQLVKRVIIWGPIVVGIVHQLLMIVPSPFRTDRIPLFLDPPGDIYPFVTLESGWWLVLTLTTFILFILAYIKRLRPYRIVYPFYFYLLVLLILVKPI